MPGAGADGGRTALLIAGPTASGKSALAVAVAERHGGVVINADALQVYAGLPILTAQPGPDDRARAPHALFGDRDPAEPSSVGRWLDDLAPVLADTMAAGRLPVLVGGTGLYFKALTQGLSAIPPVPEVVRAAVRAEAAAVPPAELHRRLAAVDPAGAARLRPTDPQRLVRALEVWHATGRSLTSFHAERAPPLLPSGRWTGVFVLPERPTLNRSIDARFDAMMAAGALDEAAQFGARRLHPALPAMRALGLPPLLAHLSGALPLEEAVARAKTQTRAYAKRQVTFGRSQLPDFAVSAPAEAVEALARGVP